MPISISCQLVDLGVMPAGVASQVKMIAAISNKYNITRHGFLLAGWVFLFSCVVAKAVIYDAKLLQTNSSNDDRDHYLI